MTGCHGWKRNGLPLPPTLDALLADIDRSLGDPIRVGELAKRQNISTSQLERRLGASVGLPVRQLVIWRRLRYAVDRVLAGASLTAAALDAGFSDAAHFSRSLRATFGVRADRSLIPVARGSQSETSRESHVGVVGASDAAVDRKGSIS